MPAERKVFRSELKSLKLADSVQLLSADTGKKSLKLKVTDPGCRQVLEYLKKKNENKSTGTGTRYGRQQNQVQKTIPDPEDPANWEVLVTFQEQSRTDESSCLCDRAGLLCCHSLAASEYLRRRKSQLKEAYIRSEKPANKSFFISDKLQELIIASADSGNYDLSPERITRLKTIADEIVSVHSDDYFEAVLDWLLSLYPGAGDYEARLLERFSLLIGAFYAEPSLRGLIEDPERLDGLTEDCYGRQERSNAVTFKRELKHFQTAASKLAKGKTEDTLYQRFLVVYSGDTDRALQFMAETLEAFDQADLKFLDAHAQEYRRAPENIRSRILEKTDRAQACPERDGLLPGLLASFTPEERAVRIVHLKNYQLDLNTYRELRRELQEQLAEYMVSDNTSLSYILETVAADWEAPRRAVLLLKLAAKLEPGQNFKGQGGLLLGAAEKLQNNTLLKLYLSAHFGLGEKLPKSRSLQLTDADITDYFIPDFQVREENGRVWTDYFLYIDNEKRPFFGFSERSGVFYAPNLPESAFSADSLKKIMAFALEGRKAEAEQKKRELEEAIQVREFEEKNKSFAKRYRALCRNLQGEKIILEDSFKVNLSYRFDFPGDAILLGFRVGNTREYVVKNVNDFMQAFRTGETVSYGKELTLTHTLENLREEDRPVIRLLYPLKFSHYGTGLQANRCLSLTGPVFSNVIELLKGRTVWAGEKEMLVRLEETEMKIGIDGQYKLKLLYNPERQRIISAGNRCYLYTEEPKGGAVIDAVKADPDRIRLIEFALRGGDVSLRPILSDFKKNIYSRFYDAFQVEDRVAKDFMLSVVRINAFFDYEGKAITLKTEYQKDEQEISRSALTERMDVAKAENFEAAVRSLGFEDSLLRDEGGILSFLKMDFSGLKRQASIYLSESLKNKRLLSVSRQVIRVSCTRSGLIDAVLEKSDFTEEELAEILQAMKKKKKFILLSGDRIVDLDSREAKEFRDTVKDLGLEAGHLYKKKRLNMVEALKAVAHENSCSIDKPLRNMVDEIRNFKDYDVKLPKLSCELRGYQEEGLRWLSVLSRYNMGGVLADDMGPGKTLQIIALIKSDPKQKPSLVVCPKSLVFNWINEFARFDGETQVTEIYGLPEKRAELIRDIDYNKKKVFVTSYDSLRNDIESYSGEFNYCVLDEAQYIKNVAAQKSKSAKEIRAVHRFALTGTPIENNIIDLWSIFDFIMPGYFEELSEFKASAGQEEFHEQVARRIGPFVLRRIKENVLSDLPAKYETVLSCDMTAEQRKTYEALRGRDTGYCCFPSL